jgi:hypothetical protein
MTFAAYPEDERVLGGNLQQLWAALAPVPTAGGYKLAEKYLSELVDRSLVPRSEYFYSWADYGADYGANYHMHDVLRDVAVQASRDKSSGCLYNMDEVWFCV